MESSQPSKGKIGVMVATPVRYWRGVDGLPEVVKREAAQLAELSESPECPCYFVAATAVGGIARARNAVVHQFLASPCKWLLFRDDDLHAPGDRPELVDALFRLLSHKKPIVAGLYTTREDNPHWVTNFMHEVKLQGDGLLQVIETGTGFKLYHRQVFENLIRIYGEQIGYTERATGERMYAFFQQVAVKTDLQPDGDFLTEDYYCDYLCRHAGIGIFVDTTVKLLHRDGDGTLYPKDGAFPPIPIDTP